MTRRVLTAAAALAVLAVGGCGGAPDKEAEAADASAGKSAAADVSTCVADAKAAPTPYGKAFPSAWPFPDGSVVFNAEDRGADGTIVTAVTDAPFREVLDFMNGEVVQAGFEVEKGETEEHDAEAEWDGGGFRGRWAIRESASCPGETVIQVLSSDG